MFIKQKLDAAKWFIDAIKQRQQTLFVTMSSIMHYQKEYFLQVYPEAAGVALLNT